MRLAVALGALLLVAGCTSPPAPRPTAPNPTAAGPTAAGTLTATPGATATASGAPVRVACTDVIGSVASPAPGDRTVLADVALPLGTVLQTAPNVPGDPVTRLFAKQGLEVRAGATVVLRVAPGWEGRARIGWGNPGVPAVGVTVSGCPAASASAPWLAFAGGFFVQRPVCLPLIVTAGGRQARVSIGVGTPCPPTRPSRS